MDFILGALREKDAASGPKNERLMSSDMALLAIIRSLTRAI